MRDDIVAKEGAWALLGNWQRAFCTCGLKTILLCVLSSSLSACTMSLHFTTDPAFKVSKSDADSEKLLIQSNGNEFTRCDLHVQDRTQHYIIRQLSFSSSADARLKNKRFKTLDPRESEAFLSGCQTVQSRQKTAPQFISTELVDATVAAILAYLKDTQIEQTKGQDRFRGEWQSLMTNNHALPFRMLGPRGYTALDSNCFVPLTIHNVLGEAYIRRQIQNPEIPLILEKAMDAILGCYSNGTFNFWHQVKLPDSIKSSHADRVRLRRGPNHFNLRKLIGHNISNVVNDADDTAAGFVALRLQEQLQKLIPSFPLAMAKPAVIGPIFASYRDMNRTARHLYDTIYNRPRNTGAFLTWFGKEDNRSALLTMLPSKTQAGIPLNKNDVDCVVNANILSALADYGELTSADGISATCRYLNRVVRDEKQVNYCGTYYPNVHNVYFAYGRAYSHGVKCLEESGDFIIDKLLREQRSDGSFSAFDDSQDMIHSTIFALGALVDFSKDREARHATQAAVNRGMNFILSKLIADDKHAFLPGGAFFSSGTIARHVIYWKSDAVTSAFFLDLILKAAEQRLLNPDAR